MGMGPGADTIRWKKAPLLPVRMCVWEAGAWGWAGLPGTRWTSLILIDWMHLEPHGN